MVQYRLSLATHRKGMGVQAELVSPGGRESESKYTRASSNGCAFYVKVRFRLFKEPSKD
jgi:hypothetical protein